MNILAIETSCDETAAAVVKNGKEVLSSIVFSQIPVHAKTGGVVPEVAARAHVEKVIPVVDEAMRKAKVGKRDISAVAVAAGPGLITSLLVGVDTAKTLAYSWGKPLVAVSHLDAHMAATEIAIMHGRSKPKKFEVRAKYPRVMLLVSGGHTQLFLERKKGDRRMLGQTLDDAAGEAFDKAAAVLNLPYPGGPSLSALAEKGDTTAYAFPRPMSASGDYMFSYSGLKTAFIDEVRELKARGVAREKARANLAASFEYALVESLYIKVERALDQYNAKQVAIVGGVAANKKLRDYFAAQTKKRTRPQVDFIVPDRPLCTDNAAIVGAAAYEKYRAKKFANPKTLEADTGFGK
ncbi:tRNA (adenosine(37)-N6)-threonylcarbamoyltransferase complex transferase subunit TsaD [Patescibacteria group bacterium]